MVWLVTVRVYTVISTCKLALKYFSLRLALASSLPDLSSLMPSRIWNGFFASLVSQHSGLSERHVGGPTFSLTPARMYECPSGHSQPTL